MTQEIAEGTTRQGRLASGLRAPARRDSVGELWARRELLWVLAGRELKVRYKQSLLGVSWALLQPLALTAVFTLFGLFVGIPTGGAPRPLFYYAAMTPWTFVAAALGLSVGSLAANNALVCKVRFPREFLVFSSIIACGADFLVGLALLPAMMLVWGVPMSLAMVWLPVLVGIQVALVAGLALVVAAANVFYRDLRFVVPLGLQLWLFASPVAYGTEVVPAGWRGLYMLNPLAPVLEGYRNVLLYGRSPEPAALAVAGLMSVTVLLLGYGLFKRLEPSFADVI